MDWFSFIAGALAGWILEWLIDLFYWRRRQSRWANEQGRLQTDLSHTQNVVSGLRAREIELSQQVSISRGDLEAANSNLSLLQGELDAARAQIEALNNQIALADTSKQALADQFNAELAASDAEATTLREQLERAQAENLALQSENATLQTHKDELEINAARFAALGGLTAAAVVAGQSTGPAGDDLTIIEGIGPKIAELLNQNGIYTFSQLADKSVPDLETVLRGGGNRFQTADPETWPRQARLAANREWTRLDALKAQLQGGVRRPGAVAAAAAVAPAAAEEPPKPASDDLTIIEGIGPKIAELLNQSGIYTFSQLADANVLDLETILRGGGTRFQTANPETWPRQARLAANREWPRLDALKAQLQGGVRRPGGEEAGMRSQAVPEPQDDLAVIEGIGPKIAEILSQNGIRTFAQLARMEPARLRLILDEAGPAYRVADPTSWQEQASWAAVGNWDRLQALKDQLHAGRRLE